MKRDQLASQLRNASYLTGSFLLRSGQTSNFYWDKYRFESDPLLLDAVAAQMRTLLPDGFAGSLAGMEMGGIPLATAVSLQTGLRCLFVRKEAKTYGTCHLVEGGFAEGTDVVVVEDVITTAGQVVTSIGQMRGLGLNITQVVCAIDRQQGGREKLAEIGCEMKSVFTLAELEAASA